MPQGCASTKRRGTLTDKCHLIIMGGTFLYGGQATRRRFMKQAFDALNGNRPRCLRPIDCD